MSLEELATFKYIFFQFDRVKNVCLHFEGRTLKKKSIDCLLYEFPVFVLCSFKKIESSVFFTSYYILYLAFFIRSFLLSFLPLSLLL